MGIIYPLAGINLSKSSFELAMPKGLLLLPGLNLPFNFAGLAFPRFQLNPSIYLCHSFHLFPRIMTRK